MHIGAYKSRSECFRVWALILAELFFFARHTIEQLILALGLTEADWSAWYRFFSALRFVYDKASEIVFGETLHHVREDELYVVGGDATQTPRSSCVDSTIITLPKALSEQSMSSGGCGEKASTSTMKVSVRWDVRGGALTQLDITSGITHNRRTHTAQTVVAVDSLQIRDLGYFKLVNFAAIDQQGANWLTRYKPGATLLSDDGQVLALPNWLSQQPGHVLDFTRMGQPTSRPLRKIPHQPICHQSR